MVVGLEGTREKAGLNLQLLRVVQARARSQRDPIQWGATATAQLILTTLELEGRPAELMVSHSTLCLAPTPQLAGGAGS